MIKVGQVWKRKGEQWTPQYQGGPVIITIVTQDYTHFRYPYWDMVGHHKGVYSTPKFTDVFELVEDVCQT